MGVTQNGETGNSFKTPQLGIRAQIQHLKAYANTTKLKQECVDQRFDLVSRGCAPYVEYLGIQENPKSKGWAAGAGYGEKILKILDAIKETGSSQAGDGSPKPDETKKDDDFKEYLITTTCDVLNIRSGAGTDAIKGTYLDNYRQIWDLYINNATCKPTELSTKTADDATADFVTGDAVFYQNGTWEYNNIKDVGDDNLGILPIYIGVEGEEDQGICTGTENYWCVNSKASEDDIQATLDFMNWCVTSDDGVKAMCKDMGFTIPFKKNLKSDNVLVNEANKYTEDGKTPVSWNFSTMPSEEWKNGVGSALTSYAADPTDANWAKVTTAFVDGWAKEAAAAK